MPSLPGLAPKQSNATHIPSPLSASHQRYSSSTLAASSSLSSVPPPGPEPYGPRSHGRLEGDDGDERRRAQHSASGSHGGSYGRKGGLRSRRSGGGFLLGMGSAYGGETAPFHGERDGMRSASDPITPFKKRNAPDSDYHSPAESSSSRQGAPQRHQTLSQNNSLTGDLLSNAGSVDSDTVHLLDELLANDNDPAEIVSMAVGMSENRKILQNSRGPPPASEGTVLPIPVRTISSGTRNGSSRPFLTSAMSQSGEPKRRRSKTPSGFLSPLNPRSRSPQSLSGHPQTLEASRRHVSQTSALALLPPSPSIPFHQQQVKMPLSFNQYQVPIVASPSTLARAAKAKQYLELFVQYLNLLHSLPPATDPHNQQPQQPHHHYYHNNSSQHSTNVAHIHPLRRYNPLQTIRNRRLRNRLGLGQLDTSPWEDARIVSQWIEQSTSQRKEYEDATRNQKTQSSGKLRLLPPPLITPPEKPKAKPKRLKMDWYVHPAEMFADFYWINECGGKAAMEDRLGGRIFPKASSSLTGSNSGRNTKDREKESNPNSVSASFSKGMDRANFQSRKGGPDDIRNSPSNKERGGYTNNTLGIKDGIPPWELDREGSEQAENRGRGYPTSRDMDSRNNARDLRRDSIIGGQEYLTDATSNSRRDELALPAGPGITIGIGGGNLSTDESSASSDSDAAVGRGRASIDSKRYSSHFEDDGMAQVPFGKARQESPERTEAERAAAKQQQHHHHHLYPHFSHRSRSRRRSNARKPRDGQYLAVNSDDSSASDSSSSEVNLGEKRLHRRWTLHKSHGNKEDVSAGDSDDTSSSDGDVGKSRTPRNGGLRAIGRRVRNKMKGESAHDLDQSDSETNYESAAAVSGISRSPSPAFPQQNKEMPPRASIDSEGRSPKFLQPSPQPTRHSLAPPLAGKPSKDKRSTSRSARGSHSRSPSPGVAIIEERGRKKTEKQEGFGIILNRRMSPTKGLFTSRRSSEFSYEDDLPDGGHGSRKSSIGKRDSKDFDRDGKDRKDSKDKSKTLSTVKKAKERVGNRVEKIKNGVGDFVRGKDVSQPSSHYASSVGSGGGLSDKDEPSEDDDVEKVKRSRLSLDIENMFRNQKKRSAKPGNRLHLSLSTLPNFDLEVAGTGTTTGSDASVDGDGDIPEDYWNSKKIGGREIPTLRILGPSRTTSQVSRRSTGGLEERRRFGSLGTMRLERQRSRLGEEIARGENDSPSSAEKVPGFPVPALGRVKLPPIATRAPPSSSTSQQPPQKNTKYLGKKDLARARALMLSTGVLARGMASQIPNQTLKGQQQQVTNPPSPSQQGQQQQQQQQLDFTGNLQLTLNKHTHLATTHSSAIHTSLTLLSQKITNFRAHTLTHLHTQISVIATQLSQNITPLVQATSDEADTLNGELSTRYNLEVKRLGDEVAMLARRRKRTGLKWVRRGGYLLLEWTVLGVMWWVWMVVVAVRLVRMVVGGVGRGVRWVLWM